MVKFKTRGGTNITGEYVYNLYLQSQIWREPFKSDWIDFYKAYRSYRDSSSYPFRANVFVPFTYSLVETMVPLLLGGVFNSDPIIAVDPRKGAVNELASVLEDVLAYFLDDDRLALYSKFQDFFKESCIYGTAFARILPKFTRQDTYNTLTKDINPALDYIEFDPIDLFRVYPDWRATDIHNMRFLIIEHDKDLDELYELAEMGFIDGGKATIDSLKKIAESPTTVDEGKIERRQGIAKDESYPIGIGPITIKILEYWDRNCTLWVASDGQIVLKATENPFGGIFPFVMLQYCRIPHELFGIGIPEMIKELQDQLNTIRNQRLDNVNLVINRMFIANRLADVDFENLVSYAGNVILTNDTEAIKPLETQDVTRSAYTEEEIIVSDAENTTGIFRYSRGGPPERRETATGVMRLQQAANTRFDAIQKSVEFNCIRQTAKLFLWFIRSFLAPDKMAAIVGQKEFMDNNGPLFYLIPIDEILKSYHFRQMGASITAVKELRAQQLLQAFQMFAALPGANVMEFARLIMKDVFGLKNIDKLLPPAQPQVPGMMGPPQPGQPQLGQPQPGQPQVATLPGNAGEPQALPGPQPTEGSPLPKSNEGMNIETLMRNLAGMNVQGMPQQ